MPTQFLRHVVACLLVLTATTATLAQSDTKTGILKIHVSPKQAYVFVDDKAIRDGSQSIVLDAGKHTVNVRNYQSLRSHAAQFGVTIEERSDL